jgi:hypothetical protein
MTSSVDTSIQAGRITAQDLKAHLQAGKAVTVIDVRNEKVWNADNVKILGAKRVNPAEFKIDPNWPKDCLTVVY